MKVENFFSLYNLFDDVQSIIRDLVYNDQISGPSTENEEQAMEHTAKLAVYSLLSSSYADKYGEIDESNIDFDDLYDSMYNAIFKTFSRYNFGYSETDAEYEDYGAHYGEYSGSYVQDVLGYSDDEINDAFDGEPDAYWNID